MKVYLVKFVSNDDGEYCFTALPYASKEVARDVLKKEKEFILKESGHFGGISDENMEAMEMVDTPDYFYINDPFDEYYEEYTIQEVELIENVQ